MQDSQNCLSPSVTLRLSRFSTPTLALAVEGGAWVRLALRRMTLAEVIPPNEWSRSGDGCQSWVGLQAEVSKARAAPVSIRRKWPPTGVVMIAPAVITRRRVPA
jgi:hypothetical protein